MSLGSIVSFTLALGIGLSFAVLLALHLGRTTRLRTVPTAVVLALVVATGLTLVGATPTRPLTWAIRDGGLRVWAGLLLAGALTATLLRYAARLDWVRALLLAQALTLVAVVSWVPKDGPPTWLRPELSMLRQCFTTKWRWRTYGPGAWVADVIPNIVLYVPVGIALALALKRRWLAAVLSIGLTVGTELYQGVFTDRECTGTDVLSNTSGALIGVLAVVAIQRVAR